MILIAIALALAVVVEGILIFLLQYNLRHLEEEVKQLWVSKQPRLPTYPPRSKP